MKPIADFNDSFERIVNQHFDVFFSAFYRCFEARTPTIAEIFENTPESRRYEMLEDSILMLMDFSVNSVVSQELNKLGQFHARMGVTPAMYDHWMDALIDTLQLLDKSFTAEEEAAWRSVLGPGLTFLKGFSDQAP